MLPGSGQFAIIGASVLLKQQNGVATSADGKKWAFHPIGLSANGYSARYGAFPTATTWYVTAGSWGDRAETEEASGRRHLTRQVSVAMDRGKEATAPLAFHYDGDAMAEANDATTGNASGWKTAIMKTTDGGKSFTQVYSHDDVGQYVDTGLKLNPNVIASHLSLSHNLYMDPFPCRYPNGIGCASEMHCVAALEGLNSSIIVTRDGGACRMGF